MKKLLVITLLAIPTYAQDIVDTAVDAGSFNTLVAAVQAAGLEDALRSDGPFTVFAPTDAAFDKLPPGTISALLNDPEALRNILLFHVTDEALTATDVIARPYLNVLNEQVALIEVNGGQVTIAGASIVATDIVTTNGIIHVIDTVMLPPSLNLVETAIQAQTFQTLVAAVQAADLVDTLAEGGPFTVFAPSDQAFAQLPDGTLEALINDPAALTQILLYHVVPGRQLAADVVSSNRISTLEGNTLAVTLSGGVFVNDAQVTATDILATNGVIHVIDKVLLPPQKEGRAYEVSVTNLTRGQVFSPPAIVSHSKSIALFTLGQPASPGLAALAEDGDVSVLAESIQGSDKVFDVMQFANPIRPGTTETATIYTRNGFSQISVAGMLTSTNDTFFAVQLVATDNFLGKLSSSVQDFAWAYDAGSEANDESCLSVPGAPCGSVGQRNQTGAEGYVFFANGVQGIGDLAASEFDWRGPVALVTIRSL
ncbi:MAG: fasciclin domain-containing protein [Acidobacteria bacterium]|nr:fasciclin domain-containing protein [Acidobacteriota bacterium]